MTNARATTRTITEHRFIVPCEGPWGGTFGDFSDAMQMAEEVGGELGLNTSNDDWCRFRCEDDQLVITVMQVGREEDAL